MSLSGYSVQLSECLSTAEASTLLPVVHFFFFFIPPVLKMGSLLRKASFFVLCRRLQRCHTVKVLDERGGFMRRQHPAKKHVCVKGVKGGGV